jgi:serine protease Do
LENYYKTKNKNTMKKLFSYIMTGFIGGLTCFILLKTAISNQPTVNPTNTSPAKLISQRSILAVPDFINSAETATPAVVHIYAEENNESVQDRYRNQRRRDPFGFSMEDLFGGGDFFGRNYYRKSGSGSGVIISKDGYIVTNNHVAGFADDITITTTDGKKYKANKIGTDPASDLALLKIDAGQNLPVLQYGDSDKVKVGEWVLAVGNPFDLTSTVTAGIVSAKGRSLNISDAEKPLNSFIQTDAAVNPGNSGGALVDTYGKLIGINTAIATPTGAFAGYSFAIPSNRVKTIVEKILKFGNIERAELGIGGYDVEESLVGELGLKVKEGFYVDGLESRGSARMAGILPGDVIVKVNNAKIASYDDIENILSTSNVGETLDILVNRNGKEMKISTLLRKPKS